LLLPESDALNLRGKKKKIITRGFIVKCKGGKELGARKGKGGK